MATLAACEAWVAQETRSAKRSTVPLLPGQRAAERTVTHGDEIDANPRGWPSCCSACYLRSGRCSLPGYRRMQVYPVRQDLNMRGRVAGDSVSENARLLRNAGGMDIFDAATNGMFPFLPGLRGPQTIHACQALRGVETSRAGRHEHTEEYQAASLPARRQRGAQGRFRGFGSQQRATDPAPRKDPCPVRFLCSIPPCEANPNVLRRTDSGGRNQGEGYIE